VAAAVKMARSGGRVLLFGIITATEGALPFYDLYFKELSLIGARVAKGEDYPSSIALGAAGNRAAGAAGQRRDAARGVEGGDWDVGLGQRTTDENHHGPRVGPGSAKEIQMSGEY